MMCNNVVPKKEKSPEIRGAMDACEECKDYNKIPCYTLRALKSIGLTYKGKCGRDTETGIYKR